MEARDTLRLTCLFSVSMTFLLAYAAFEGLHTTLSPASVPPWIGFLSIDKSCSLRKKPVRPNSLWKEWMTCDHSAHIWNMSIPVWSHYMWQLQFSRMSESSDLFTENGSVSQWSENIPDAYRKYYGVRQSCHFLSHPQTNCSTHPIICMFFSSTLKPQVFLKVFMDTLPLRYLFDEDASYWVSNSPGVPKEILRKCHQNVPFQVCKVQILYYHLNKIFMRMLAFSKQQLIQSEILFL